MSISKKARLKVKDDTEAIMKIANSQKKSALATMHSFLEKQTWALFDYANATNLAYSVLAPDGLPLLSATHAWNSTGGTFDNDLGTTAISLTSAAAIKAYGGAFTDANGNAMPLRFNKIYVKTGGLASKQALSVYAAKNAQGQYQTTNLVDINIYQ